MLRTRSSASRCEYIFDHVNEFFQPSRILIWIRYPFFRFSGRLVNVTFHFQWIM